MVCVGMRGFLRVDDNRPDNAGITPRISGDQAQIMVWTWPWRVVRAYLGRAHCTATGRKGGTERGREPQERPRAWAQPAGPGLSLRDSDPQRPPRFQLPPA